MILKWIARLSAGLFAVGVAALFIGEGFPGGDQGLSLRESLMLLSFFAVWAGYLIGWRAELIGGLTIVSGIIVFYLLNRAFSGSFPSGPYFPLMGLPGVLFILSSMRKSQPT